MAALCWSSREETPDVQGKRNPSKTVGVARGHQRADTLKPYSEKTPSSNNTREDSIHGHHHMVNTEIRLIIFFAAKDGEALYSQQKQDWEMTVAQIMTPYCKIQT